MSGRSAHLLEKDIWVVTVLDILFSAPFGGDLVFKGGWEPFEELMDACAGLERRANGR